MSCIKGQAVAGCSQTWPVPALFEHAMLLAARMS